MPQSGVEKADDLLVDKGLMRPRITNFGFSVVAANFGSHLSNKGLCDPDRADLPIGRLRTKRRRSKVSGASHSDT